MNSANKCIYQIVARIVTRHTVARSGVDDIKLFCAESDFVDEMLHFGDLEASTFKGIYYSIYNGYIYLLYNVYEIHEISHHAHNLIYATED